MTSRGLWLILAMLAAARPAGAADDGLVREALSRFPRATAHFEVCDLAKMRALPGYAGLRQRFLGGDMQQLAASLEALGLHEEDIDRLVLGAGPVADRPGLEVYGVAQGRLDPGAMASAAQAAGIAPLRINGYAAYCFGDAVTAPCVAMLDASRGVFGSRDLVDYMLYAAPDTDSLAADPLVSARVAKAPGDATLWGMASGPAVAEWVRVVIPMPAEGQQGLAPLLSGVVSLAYEVRAAQKVALPAELTCVSADAALRLRQTFDGVRALQQAAWRALQPGVPNPYEHLSFRSQGSQVMVSLTAEYAAFGQGQ